MAQSRSLHRQLGRTLLMRPLRLLRSASHVMRWYSGLLLSTSCIMRASLKGGMYTPPVRFAGAGLRSTAAGAAATASPLDAAAAGGAPDDEGRSAARRSACARPLPFRSRALQV